MNIIERAGGHMQSLVDAVDTGLWGFGERSGINRKKLRQSECE